MSNTNTKPTHEQARLQLQIYDLRREPRLRQARDWFFKNFFAANFEEAIKIAPPMSENGALFNMVVSYWEQACGLLNYGLLHEDLFFENNGEFFGVWERIKPGVQEGRERFAYKQFAANMEQAAQKYEQWIERRSPGHVAAFREFGKQMRAQSAKVA
ncbi:MAG TPA: hypothetical protein VE994_07745 [Terriglobales bacterium]|nr:hypothetical protein [Terriglobales bacterium]